MVLWAVFSLFAPNECADTLAKSTATGLSSQQKSLPPILRCRTLPVSISASRQVALSHLHTRWKQRWKTSPHYKALQRLDKSLPSKSYHKLIEPLTRTQSAHLTQLQTGHSPLNSHLFRIRKAESPSCPHCAGLVIETTCHYLLECPHYRHKRHLHLTRPLCRNVASLPFLLSSKPRAKHITRYTTATKRFAPHP